MGEEFTCSAPDLSRTSVNESVWTLEAEDRAHLDSVRSIAAFQIIYVVLGVPWNLVVIGVILVNKLFSKPTHLLLLSLAVSDLLICICVMPFNIITALAGRFFIGSSDYARCQVCHFYVITIIVMIYVSLFIVALMAIDRLIYIKYPLQYQNIMTIKKMSVMVVVVWTFCILIGLPPVFGFGEIRFSNIVGSCTTIFSAETTVGPSVYYIIMLVVIALFPFFTTLVANVWLLIVIRKTIRRRFTRKMTTTMSLPATGQPSFERARSVHKIKSNFNQQQISLAKVFGAIFIVNTITWIPTVFISFASGAVGSENVPPEAFSFVFLAFLSQPAIHPMLEAFLVKKIRDTMMKYVFCCKRREQHKNTLVFQNQPGGNGNGEASFTSITTVSNQ